MRVFAVVLDERAEALTAAATPLPASKGKVHASALLVGLALVAVGLGVGAWQALAPAFAPGPAERVALEAGKPSIAVLPFDNLSDDPKQEHFADGLTDDLMAGRAVDLE